MAFRDSRALVYVSQPADHSLQSLLVEAFKMLELRFGLYDTDNAGIVTFNELRCAHSTERGGERSRQEDTQASLPSRVGARNTLDT